MLERNESLHLEIQHYRKGPVGILRSSYHSDGKTKHNQYGRFTGQTLEHLKILQLAFRGKAIAADDADAFQIESSREYGASFVALEIIKQTGLDRVIYSRPEPWVKDIQVMIAGRIVYAGSKLSLCNQYNNTCLWELCNVHDKPDVNKHCYASLDKLLARQKAIQKQLANKHIKQGHLVLYDITSSYLEGEYSQSELAEYGYSRDSKAKHEQIVIGLLCSAEGCPVAIEVFPGNTKDETTVIDKVQELKHSYDISKIIFVGDRGMVTQKIATELETVEDILTIGALTRNEMSQLIERNVIQPSLFDEHNICEIVDPAIVGKRYCLCKNPFSAERDLATRQRLLDLTTEALDKIVHYKQRSTVELLGSRIGKILQKYKMSKYISWHINRDKGQNKSLDHKVIWSLNQSKLADAKRLDGCYIITTKVALQDMDKQQVVASYKGLQMVEQAFRNLKTVQLEMRPIYHKLDDRIRAHVFLCMLSYYVQWHMQKLLKPLFKNDSEGKNRRWTFENVIDTLRMITRNKCSVAGTIFHRNSNLTNEQKKILQYLKVEVQHDIKNIP